jgi:hypothetical protein
MEHDILRRFFSYRATQLQGLVDAVRDLIKHGLTKGVEAEQALASLLQSVLPLRFSSGKGFLIDTGGHQSHEIDLIVLDAMNTARLFDFRAFELVPVEAALACIEVKTTLTKSELDDTFTRFQAIHDMDFIQEKVIRPSSDFEGGAGFSVATTSRPGLIVFAYNNAVSDEAIADAYRRHPDLDYAKICALQRGIAGVLTQPPIGLSWLSPNEEEDNRRAGQVLALFLFQYLLPALSAQSKGQHFYIKYLAGQSTVSPILQR